MSGDRLDEVADELYGLPPGEFVAVRNARAKEAKSGGDRDLAAAITALAKPTKVAWLANQLVRQRRDDVAPLLELGAGLREATASLSGEDLRRLAKQQHQLVHALVQQAKSLAGGPVTQDVADGVDKTLRAALADSDLADQLLEARLTDGLEFSGFGGGSGAAPVRPKLAVVEEPPRRSGADAKAAARREAINRAEQELAQARMRAAATDQEREESQSAADAAAAATRALVDRLDELRTDLERVKGEKDAAEQAERTAHKALEVAERAARGAGRKAAEAEAALAALGEQE
jgi:hypothetical protein